jgi:hypothetical protein
LTLAQAGEPSDFYRMELQAPAPSLGLEAQVPLVLTASAAVEGLVAVFEWDPNVAEGLALVPGAVLDAADLVVSRVEAGFMALGVIADIDGVAGETVPAGENLLAAQVLLRRAAPAVQPSSTALHFVDGRYSMTEGGPALDNLVTVGGQGVYAPELVLVDGQVTFQATPRIRFEVAEGASGPFGGNGEATVRMDNPADDVEGYVVALVHDAGLELQDVGTGGTVAESAGADFVQADVFPEGGTLGVVLDLLPPFDGNVVSRGARQPIARFRYRCPRTAAPPVFALRFVDGLLGSPPRSNVAVVGGFSVTPELLDGEFTCVPAQEVCDDLDDNDGDGLVDCADPDCASADCAAPRQAFACGGRVQSADSLPPVAEGEVGGNALVCFYYRSVDERPPGEPRLDQVQGLSMAIAYDCDLECEDGSFDVTETIVEAVRAEFVSQQCDNDAADGDGCEFVLGMLVDALPPFDGATLPPTQAFLRLGCLRFRLDDRQELCGRRLGVRFQDGVNGRGSVPIRNLVAVANRSFRPSVEDCEVLVSERGRFFRGDCNFSQIAGIPVTVSDAAAVVSFLFGRGSRGFLPPCLDACDCNDDGRVDLADAICALIYLFSFGPLPPDPGPGIDRQGRPTPPGVDTTEDPLDCAAGRQCSE